MHSLKNLFIAGFLVFTLSAGCAFRPDIAAEDSLSQQSAKPSATAASEASATAKTSDAASVSTSDAQSTIIKPLKAGAGQPETLSEKQLKAGADAPGGQARGGMISLNFDNADIFEVINALSEFLDINYIIDPAIKGKVNIHTTSEVDKGQLLAILETIFELNNISVVKQGDFYKILPSKDAQKQGVPVGIGREAEKPDSLDRMTLQIIPLKYIASAEVVKAIKPFTSKNGEMIESAKTNIIIVFDTAANIQKILKLVSIIDSDAFEQNEVRFFKIKNANVTDLAKELEGIFTSIGIEKATGKGIGLGIVPVERAGMVVAVTSIAGLLDQVQHWVEVLDTIDKDADEQIFIYFVENGRAEEISDILTQLYGGAGSMGTGGRTERMSGRTGSRSSRGSGSTSMSSRTSRSSRYGSSSSRAARDSGSTTGSRSRTGASRTGGRTGGTMDEDIMIVTDESTNAIIVRSSPQDYTKIRETIQRLDIIPRQVLIEVLIAEVRLKGTMQFGVEWMLKQNYDSLGGYDGQSKSGLSSFPDTVPGLVNALNPANAAGAGFTYLFSSDRLKAFLLAQANDSKVNTLATPNILIADNQEAHIEVGKEVPIVTSEYVPFETQSDTSSTSRSIEYRNTGVILDVTPRINDRGLVALEISQEVSSVDTEATSSGIESPTFNNKKAETSVVVQDGDTVVIGGIIEDATGNVTSGIPFLSKVPLISYLFGYTGNTKEKRELIIMLTPHVVKNGGEAAALTSEYKSKMEEIHKLLKRDKSQWAKPYR